MIFYALAALGAYLVLRKPGPVLPPTTAAPPVKPVPPSMLVPGYAWGTWGHAGSETEPPTIGYLSPDGTMHPYSPGAAVVMLPGPP